MSRYVLRRLVLAAFTVFGVMLLTFILFRVIAGDVSVAYVNQKLGSEARHAFYEKHKLDRPAVFNYHRRIEFVDQTTGGGVFSAVDEHGSAAAKGLELHLVSVDGEGAEGKLALAGQLVFALSPETPIGKLTGDEPLVVQAEVPDSGAPPVPSTVFRLSDGSSFSVPIGAFETCGLLLEAINGADGNSGKLIARLSEWSVGNLFDAQFFWHLKENLTFSGRSYATEQTLLEIIGERAKFSLALTIPAMALGWLVAMVISVFVAYYRDTWIDRLGVFLSVLGMCVPYLAYMLLGQLIMFKIAPKVAIGLSHPVSIYVPVLIAVVAGTGGAVRFYRTVILDEINRDYVRTARAKGVALPTILFVHVLRNCMLPILTNLISSIPFLIMGSLLLERFFGIPGLGDLMLSSITSRDVPIITGLTFLTSVLYVTSLLVTDVLYAVFDPRIRLT
jgi:peptide/nickel transport system permease protein